MRSDRIHEGEEDQEDRRLDPDEAEQSRRLDELLAELRVAMPGVQILFGFLLTVPFSSRFPDISPFLEVVYLVTLICSAVSSALFIAPSVHHRILINRRDKEELVRTGTQLAIVGLVFLALAMAGSVLLVTDFLFGTAAVAIAMSIVTIVFLLAWFALAFSRRLRRSSNP